MRKLLHRIPSNIRLLLAAATLSAGVASPAAAVTVFSDNFQSYTVADPATMTNWVHNGLGTAPNASRIFDTVNYGGTRLWIASAANATLGSGINSTATITLAPATPYVFSAALVTDASDSARTATGTFDLLYGATSLIGGPQAFTARGDDSGGAGNDSYLDQMTTFPFNSGAGGNVTIKIAFSGTDASNPFVGIDDVMIRTPPPVLEINRGTAGANGAITFRNPGPDAVANIIGYSMTSAAGGLNATTWDRQSTGTNLTNDNDQWTLIEGTSNELAEAVLNSTGDDNGGDVPASGGAWSFGNAWRKSPFQDVNLELLMDDGSILSNADQDFSISYIGSAIPSGDFNFDGAVTVADWPLFKAKYRSSNLAAVGTPASHSAELYNLGDINLDGAYTLADFTAFEAAYDAVNGVGAFAAIPEPATATLLVICGTTFMMIRRKNFAPRRGRLLTVLAVTAAAAFGAAPNASAQLTPTISNAWSGVAGDRANHSAFIFKATAGNFPNSVSPLGIIDGSSTFTLNSMQFTRPANDALNSTNDPAVHATNPGALSALTAPVFLDVYTTRTGTTDLNFTGFLASSTNSFAWESPLGTETIAPGANYTFNFSGLTLDKNTEYWMVFSETSGDGDVGNFRTRVNLASTGPLANQGTGYLASAIQTVTPGATPTNRDWGVEYVAGLPSIPALKLRVNTTTGRTSIVNEGSAIGYQMNSYSITSANSLAPSKWNSLEDQVFDGDPTPGNKDNGDSWEEFDSVSSSFVGEGFLIDAQNTTNVVNGDKLPLGRIFSGTQDLAFTYTTLNLPGVITGSVQYVTGGFTADFDNDNDVDGNDLTKWKNDVGAGAGSDADGDGDSDGNDFLAWQRQLGSSLPAEVATVAVPEPSSLALLAAAVGGLSLCFRKRKQEGATAMVRPNGRIVAASATLVVGATLAATATAGVTNDRDYRLGEGAGEGGVAGAVVGSGNAFAGDSLDDTGPSGAFLDLKQTGDAVYLNVFAGPKARPGTTAGALGVQFDGTDDVLSGTRLSRPDELDDILDPPAPDPPVNYPHNYDGITVRGLQGWVYPDQAGLNAALYQSVVFDGFYAGGPAITADGKWTQSNSEHFSVPATVPVVGNTWHHVMHHNYPRAGANAFRSVMYVNGIAVSANDDTIPLGKPTNMAGLLVIGGSEVAGGGATPVYGNYFRGAVDNLEMYVVGDNTALGGQNWGTFDLFADNEWIANQIATTVPGGVLDPGDVNRDGDVNASDVPVFIAGWRQSKVLDGAHGKVPAGDWETWGWGDMDHDGTVNLADAFILHAALDAAGLALNFELLSAAVPEPSSWALLAVGVAGFKALGRRGGRVAG